MYQPSDVLPQTRFSGISHLNPLASADPDEMLGFPSQEGMSRFAEERSSRYESHSRFSDRYKNSCGLEQGEANRFDVVIIAFGW